MARVALHLLSLAAAMGLAGCVEPPSARSPLPARAAPSRVAILLPLSGSNAALGRDLLKATQLALSDSGLQLDVRDTGGTPDGAAAAAAQSLAEHDGAIIGPLTSGETVAAAGAARGIPVLAFTSDRQVGRPGIWPLGLTPEQQTVRLLQALAGQDRRRVAAVLPDNAFGNAIASGLARAAHDQAGMTVEIRQYPDGKLAALEAALKDVSSYNNRRNAADLGAQPAANPATDPAAPPVKPAMEPPPFDALMLAASGSVLRGAMNLLPGQDIHLPQVRVVGPATWSREARAGLDGVWFAAPDPAARADYERAFTARFGGPPPPQSDVAYDAARLAVNLARDRTMLTRPTRYAGIDGLMTLSPDGQVQRELAVFEIKPTGPILVESPSAASPSAALPSPAPGS